MSDSSRNSLLPLIDEIKWAAEAASSKGPQGHAEVLRRINDCLLAAETPLETIYRIGHQSWQNASIRVALDLGLFEMIVRSSPQAISAQELAQKTEADQQLIVRLMRVLAAMGLCEEAEIDSQSEAYLGNAKTKILIEEQGVYSFKTWIDMAMPTATKLPEYFRKYGYSNPWDSSKSAFSFAFGEEFWSFLKQNPEQSAVFNGFMASRRHGRPSWFDIYPIERELAPSASDFGDDDILLIDVGGNKGHDLLNLRAKHTHLPGKFILQDLPTVVDQLVFSDPRIFAMAHNFFEPQPVKHARAYHFRAIFHDWPDDRCRQILRHTASAMRYGYSKLLISELVLPQRGAALFPASLDIQMMGLHAGMERSETQWQQLLESEGLEIVKVWQLMPGGESVIEARLKEKEEFTTAA